MASRVKEVIVPFCFAIIRPHLEYRIQAWGPQHKDDMKLLNQVQKRAMKKIRGLEHSSMKTGMAAGLVQLREDFREASLWPSST